MNPKTEDVSRILQTLSGTAVGADDRSSQRLFEIVYAELYQLACDRMRNERSDHTLQPTALVNEVYLRLVSPNENKNWDSKGHFFGAAARAMRQILIDNARKKLAKKRSAEGQRVDMELDLASSQLDDQTLIRLHEALSELEKIDPPKALLVELRFFGGLSTEQLCEALSISRATAHRHWKQAQAWLFLKISD